MGLILGFGWSPTPLVDVADDRLTALVDVDVFEGHTLLAFAAMTVQRLHERGVGPGELIRLVEVFVPPLERLLTEHRPAHTIHRGFMEPD